MVEFPCNLINYFQNFKNIKGNINPDCSFVGYNFNEDFGINGTVKLLGKLEPDTYKQNKVSFKVEKVIK